MLYAIYLKIGWCACDLCWLQDIIAARKGAVDAARSPLIGLQQRLCPFSDEVTAFKKSLKAVHE
jgi:hypothetical protein